MTTRKTVLKNWARFGIWRELQRWNFSSVVQVHKHRQHRPHWAPESMFGFNLDALHLGLNRTHRTQAAPFGPHGTPHSQHPRQDLEQHQPKPLKPIIQHHYSNGNRNRTQNITPSASTRDPWHQVPFLWEPLQLKQSGESIYWIKFNQPISCNLLVWEKQKETHGKDWQRTRITTMRLYWKSGRLALWSLKSFEPDKL